MDLSVYISHIQSYIGSEVPVGTTGLILILSIQECPYALLDLYLFYRYESTRRYYRAYTYLTDMTVPIGTTELILILLIREYP